MSTDTVISLTGVDKQSWREGWDELLDASPTRPLFHRVSYPPRLSLNGILISFLCTLLIVFMGFVGVNLPSPLDLQYLNQPQAASQLVFIQYTFQLPMMLLVGALMGPFMGTAALLLFMAIGLAVYPVFANGGGWQYIAQPGFGYLLGTLMMAYLLGKTFHKAFHKEDKASRSLKLLSMTLAAVFMVHLVGILYMVGLTLAGQIAWSDLPGWMLRLTVETAPYDMLSTFIFLCLVRQIRLGLWLVLY